MLHDVNKILNHVHGQIDLICAWPDRLDSCLPLGAAGVHVNASIQSHGFSCCYNLLHVTVKNNYSGTQFNKVDNTEDFCYSFIITIISYRCSYFLGS